MNLSSAAAGARSGRAPAASKAPEQADRRCMADLPWCCRSDDAARRRGRPAASGVRGRGEEAAGGGCSTTRPRCRNTTSSASRRAWPRSWVVMTILVPRAWMAGDQPLDRPGRGRVEARGRLVEEQHLGLERPGAGQRQALLLAAGEHARRPRRRDGRGRPARAPPRPARRARRRGTPRDAQRIVDVGGGRAAQQHRALEHHRLRAARTRAVGRRPAQRIVAGGRAQQAVQQAQQQALAGAVRADDHGASGRPRASRSTPSISRRPPASKPGRAAAAAGWAVVGAAAARHRLVRAWRARHQA